MTSTHSPAKGARRPDAHTIVRVRDLRRTFTEGRSSRVVLDGVDFEVRAGEFVALLGRSGSGKSTLLNLLAGIDQADGGHIEIEGRDLASLSDKDRTIFRRDHLGIVFQFFNLIPTLTVMENLLLRLDLGGRLDDRAKTRAHDLLAEVGLGDRADSYPERLSGGEQQRVAIAGALVHDPSVILADEPTGTLDARTGTMVLDLLDDLVRRSGRTMIVATHSDELVARADRVLRVAEGKVTPEDIPDHLHHAS